jgi:hypothetical protein
MGRMRLSGMAAVRLQVVAAAASELSCSFVLADWSSKKEEEEVVVVVATPEARLTCVKLQRGAEERKRLEWRFSTELRLQQQRLPRRGGAC